VLSTGSSDMKTENKIEHQILSVSVAAPNEVELSSDRNSATSEILV
jgi:hypothetical protein